MNVILLMGRLGKDPIVRYTQAGAPVVTLSVATEESFKTREGDWKKNTTWHDVVAFQKQAELAQYFVKGDEVFVEGSINKREYEANDGTKRRVVEVRAKTIRAMSAVQETEPRQTRQPASRRPVQPDMVSDPRGNPEDFDDEIPF